MNSNVLLLNMFPDYEPPEALKSAVSQAAIVDAEIDPQNRALSIVIFSEQYIQLRDLEQICRGIESAYGLKTLTLLPLHPAAQLQNVPPEDLMALFVA